MNKFATVDDRVNKNQINKLFLEAMSWNDLYKKFSKALVTINFQKLIILHVRSKNWMKIMCFLWINIILNMIE